MSTGTQAPAALLYVVGASGSGKDTLMAAARAQLAGEPRVAFAHRYITRPADAGGENHVALDPLEFEARRAGGLFALDWDSHGQRYGVGLEVRLWLDRGVTVVLNGSRGHLDAASAVFPQLVPVWIRVDAEVLRRRLEGRGRESADQIEGRLERHRTLDREPDLGEVVHNDASVEAGAAALVAAIRRHAGLPACA